MAEFKVIRHLGSVLLQKDTVLKVRLVEVSANNGTKHATLSIHEWVRPRADYETTADKDTNGYIPTKKVISFRVDAGSTKLVAWLRDKLAAALASPEYQNLVETAVKAAAIKASANSKPAADDTAARAAAQYKALQTAGLKPKAIGAAMVAAWGEELARAVMAGKAPTAKEDKPPVDPPEAIEEVG